MMVSKIFADEGRNYAKMLLRLIPKIPFESHAPAKLLKIMTQVRFLNKCKVVYLTVCLPN